MRRRTLEALGVVLSLCACLSLASGETCGNGLIDSTEQCDDYNIYNDDGCSENCTVESHYHCTQPNSTTPSECVMVLLDLSSGDHTTLDRSLEFSELFTPIPLVDSTSLEFLASVNWTYLDFVVLQGEGVSIREEVNLIFTGIPTPPEPHVLDLYPSVYPDGVNGLMFAEGSRIEIERSIADSRMEEGDLETVLLALTYEASQIPSDYLPRYVCLIASNTTLETTACVSLYYIGMNVNTPTVSYEDADIAQFIEGQIEEVPIIRGNITVADADHPTRFLMESATVRIVDFVSGSPEWLSVSSDFNFPNLTTNFDDVTGTLLISGNATTQVYSNALQYLTYFNNMTEPHEHRQIEVTIFDGIQYSDPIYIRVNIMNTNDAPIVLLDGEAPVITGNYTENFGEVVIVPHIQVIDTDPNAQITRARVVLVNAVDGGDELLSLSVTEGLTVNFTSPPHSLELSGVGSPANYTAALRTLTYHHLSDGPATQNRLIEFTVEDSHNAISSTAELTLEIIPINDVPQLTFSSGRVEEQFSYTEDDPPINIGLNLSLEDVDSPIQSISLLFTNVLDGARDSIGYDSVLAESLSVSITDNGTLRLIVFSGAYSDSHYTELLRSLTYTNLHTNNSVTDGLRSISISATDTEGAETDTSLTVLVAVSERNDGPAVDLGAGSDAGFTITYTEGGHDVPIGLSHLISVMDEEGHTISGMDIELVAMNGDLDEEETLLIRSQEILPFILDEDTVFSRTMISISLPGSGSDYAAALQTVRYTNTKDEPTLFNVTGAKLQREIVIRINDSALPVPTTNVVRVTVQIEAINNNAPRIIINSYPSCTQDIRDEDDMEGVVNRRSADSSIARATQRSRRKSTYIRNANNHAGPQVFKVDVGFVETGNKTCLSWLVVEFTTDTSAPVIEVQRELESVMTFAPASLAKTPHHGYWRDYRTLVIAFRDCVEWESTNKPLYVVFYGSEGSCDWDSPCDKGVCYYNSTGCPVVGYHRVNTSINKGGSPTHDPVEDFSTQYGPDRMSVLMLCLVLLMAVVTVAVCHCSTTLKECYERGHNIPEKKLARSVLPSNIMDLHICPYTVKSPLTHNDNIGENVKLPLAIHTDHYPPCAATITPTVGKVVCDGDPGVMVREKSCHHESGGSLETGKEEEEEKRVCDVLWRDKEDRTGAAKQRGHSGVEMVQVCTENSREHSRPLSSDQQSNSTQNLH